MWNPEDVDVDSRIHGESIMTGNHPNDFLGYDLSIIVQIKEQSHTGIRMLMCERSYNRAHDLL